MKVYCMKLSLLKTKDNKQFYKASCYSDFGFMFDLFLDKDKFDLFSEYVAEQGFLDITDDVELRYNKKLDKLEYYLKNNI